MTRFRKSIATALTLAAAITLPAQTAQASQKDNGDRASTTAPVCVWEDKAAADAKDISRGACFTFGYHEDTFHWFYSEFDQRNIGYVTVQDGYFTDLIFDRDVGLNSRNRRIPRDAAITIPEDAVLTRVLVHRTSVARAHPQTKACLYKDEGWFELHREEHARCFPAGDYPDVSLPQFDAAGWFRFIDLRAGQQATVYTGKNFTGASFTVTSDGRIIPPIGNRSFRPHIPGWLEYEFPKLIKSIKISRAR